ncbi:MAG TPA: hypothetical protein DCS24_05780 [Erythrobacter sp.]|nr:hypothetical protein [Erythrobacter sp.]
MVRSFAESFLERKQFANFLKGGENSLAAETFPANQAKDQEQAKGTILMKHAILRLALFATSSEDARG